MVNLPYVGDTPAHPGDLATRDSVTTTVNALVPSRTTVTAQVTGLAASTYATQTYIDTQDSNYADRSYVDAHDALNILNSSTILGQPNGVATLDSATKVPLAQMPNMGSGYILGPFGMTARSNTDVDTSSSPATKVLIGEWNLGVRNIPFRPLVFLNCFAKSVGGQPLIEIKMADTLTVPSYAAAGEVIGQALGRTLWTDFQSLNVIPGPNTAGMAATNLPNSYRIYITAWLSDLSSTAGVVMASDNVASASVYLVRGG